MQRVAFGFVFSLAALVAASPALSADLDYPPEIRGGYNQWEEADNPLVDFEAGLRYGYSIGRVVANGITAAAPLTGTSAGMSDKSHALETYLRINDYATNTYLKAFAGHTISLDTAYSSVLGSGSRSAGRLAYITSDFGYAPINHEGDNVSAKLAGFIGYQYSVEGQDVDNTSAVRPSGLFVNALRLGANAKADISKFSVEADVAVLPFAFVNGQTGINGVGAPINVNARGWGASADIMARYNVNETFSAGVGARANYITSRGDFSYGATTGTVDSLSIWRYGILAELKAKF